jgi:hypothetical protein
MVRMVCPRKWTLKEKRLTTVIVDSERLVAVR